jgi:ferredoxin
MPYKFTFNKDVCIQCGVCGDSCPVNALDFTRPLHKNLEDSEHKTEDSSDMTEYPIQVNKCIGCMICPEECPVSCIDIIETDKEPPYFPVQGPMKTEEPPEPAFGLTEFTKLRPTRLKSKDPWGKAYTYRPRRRKFQTQTWETMPHE